MCILNLFFIDIYTISDVLNWYNLKFGFNIPLISSFSAHVTCFGKRDELHLPEMAPPSLDVNADGVGMDVPLAVPLANATVMSSVSKAFHFPTIEQLIAHRRLEEGVEEEETIDDDVYVEPYEDDDIFKSDDSGKKFD